MEYRIISGCGWPRKWKLTLLPFPCADTLKTWQQSFISACIGSFLAAVVVVLMARPGAKYHIGL